MEYPPVQAADRWQTVTAGHPVQSCDSLAEAATRLIARDSRMTEKTRIRARPKNIAIALLGAAVIGLGTVVALDHTTTASQPAPARQSAASLTPALNSFIGTAATGTGTASTAGKQGFAQRVAQLFGLTPEQLKSDVQSGQTLDQIAGAKDQTIKNEIVAYLSMALDKAVSKGAITHDQASSVTSDVTDLVNQLFAAKLGALGTGG